MHKMTGLRQPLHLVTKITVSHLRQLIHHCHWSIPCLCLLATAYPSARPGPCDEQPPPINIPPSTTLQLTFYIKKKKKKKMKKKKKKGTPIFNFTFLFYFTIKYWWEHSIGIHI